jgi:hypothetical protein
MGMAKMLHFRYNYVMPARTKILSAIAGALLMALCISQGEMLLPHALAEDKVVTSTQTEIMEKLLWTMKILNVAAFMSLKFISWLANPDTIFGVNDNSGILLRMWQISRDIMNLIFAILLLGGAIMTIVFAKQDIIKQNIVKFLLAVVLVNFSWFFPRVILDIANVTTATIYNLPQIVTAGSATVSTAPCVWRDETGTQRECIVMTDVIFEGSSATCPTSTVAPMDLAIAEVCFTTYDPAANTAFGIINGLVLNHGRLMHLGLIVGAPPAGGIGTDVRDAMYFGFILAIITFLNFTLIFPIIALAVVMMVRIPVLWLTISFMPFMFIGFLIGDKFIKVNTMSIFSKHFMVAAFLPTLIAIPFSIGFIMLNAFATLYPAAPAGLAEDFDIVAEVHTWWDMLWILVSFMVIWKGAQWAMKSDEIYAKFTEPVFNAGKNFLQLPLNAPIFAHDTNKNGRQDPGEERFGIKDAFRTTQSDKGLSNAVFGDLGKGAAQRNNPAAQDAANELNNKGFNQEQLDKLGDSNIELKNVKDILTKIEDAVKSKTGQSNNLNLKLDVLQKAATAQGVTITPNQLNEITKKLKEAGNI